MQTMLEKTVSVIKSQIELLDRNSNVNALRRLHHDVGLMSAVFDSGSIFKGHRSVDLMPATAATTKKLRHCTVPVSTPCRR